MCQKCNGTGKVKEKPCGICTGRGVAAIPVTGGTRKSDNSVRLPDAALGPCWKCNATGEV